MYETGSICLQTVQINSDTLHTSFMYLMNSRGPRMYQTYQLYCRMNAITGIVQGYFC